MAGSRNLVALMKAADIDEVVLQGGGEPPGEHGHPVLAALALAGQ